MVAENRGAFHVAMEAWNSQASAGYFWYEGLTSDNNLGTLVCSQDANLFRADGDCHDIFGDYYAKVFPACSGHRWELSICQRDIIRSRLDNALMHELGHVLGMDHPDQGRHQDRNEGVPALMTSGGNGLPGERIHFIPPFDALCAQEVGGGRALMIRLLVRVPDASGDGFRWVSEGLLSPGDFDHEWPAAPVTHRRVGGTAAVFGFDGSNSNSWSAIALGVLATQPARIPGLRAFYASPSTLADRVWSGRGIFGAVSSWIDTSATLRWREFQFAFARGFDPDRSEDAAIMLTQPEPTVWRLGWTTGTPMNLDTYSAMVPLRVCRGQTSYDATGNRCLDPEAISSVNSVGFAIEPLSEVPVLTWRNAHYQYPSAFPEGACQSPDPPLHCDAPMWQVMATVGRSQGDSAGDIFGWAQRLLIPADSGAESPTPLLAVSNAPVACAPAVVGFLGGQPRCWIAFVQQDLTGWSNRVMVAELRTSPGVGTAESMTIEFGRGPIALNRSDGDPLRTGSDIGLTYVRGNGANGTFYLFVKSMRDGQHIQIYRHRTWEPANAPWTLEDEIEGIPDVYPNTGIRGPIIQSLSRPDVPLVLVTDG